MDFSVSETSMKRTVGWLWSVRKETLDDNIQEQPQDNVPNIPSRRFVLPSVLVCGYLRMIKQSTVKMNCDGAHEPATDQALLGNLLASNSSICSAIDPSKKQKLPPSTHISPSGGLYWCLRRKKLVMENTSFVSHYCRGLKQDASAKKTMNGFYVVRRARPAGAALSFACRGRWVSNPSVCLTPPHNGHLLNTQALDVEHAHVASACRAWLRRG